MILNRIRPVPSRKRSLLYLFLVSLSLPSLGAAQTPMDILPLQIIRTIQVTGVTLLTVEEMNAVTHPFLEQEVSADVINNLATMLTRAYTQKGFFLAKAYLPEQEIQNGKVVIAVLEGTLGNISITGNEYYSTPFIQKHFIDSDRPRGARLDLIKRAQLILSDYTDLQAKVFLQAGVATGTADMQVQVQDSPPAHLTLDYDNWGSRYISRHRFGIGVDIGNLWSAGHLLSLNGTLGSPLKDMTIFRVGYIAPLGYTGRKIHFSYMRGDFDVGQEFAQLDIQMKTESLGLSVSYPFLKTDRLGLTGSVGLEGKDFTQKTLATISSRDRIRVIKGSLDYHRVQDNRRDSVALQLSQGVGHLLGGLHQGSSFSSRPGADNQFTKGTIEAIHIQTLPAPYWLFHPLSVILRGGFQISSDNLVVGEQFVLGGPDSVRGYANGEFLGDYGYRTSGELRIFPLKNNRYFQGTVFLDHGRGFMRGRKESQSLTGMGWGLRFDFPKTFTFREPGPETPGYTLESRFQIGVDMAYPLSPHRSSLGKNPVYLLHAAASF